MKLDLSAFENWDRLNWQLASRFQIPSEISVRCSQGLPSAIYELAIGVAQFYSHKKSAAVITGRTPHDQWIWPYLFKEGYQVQQLAAEKSATEIVASLHKDINFVLVCEDHPITGEIYPVDELETLLNEKKIFCFRISHQAHFFKPTSIQPYTARICSWSPRLAVAFVGPKIKSQPMISPALDWNEQQVLHEMDLIQQETLQDEKAVLDFEKKIGGTGLQVFSVAAQRCYDRSLIYSSEIGGEALQKSLAQLLGITLAPPGWERRLETTHLCRWGGIRHYEWWQGRPADDVLRGLIALDISLIKNSRIHEFLDKASQECRFVQQP
ncbi:MAG: hypothetical protein COT73_07835 [Bdellovibrio sp. CG10_big_fil_rev_8_21_14_0_10_47_8]|nr:MAG: hypothetical protein COT73_07835 [Bdellovibrio sp. CG10_big_fil_rev_8_21_14_0_10_47_8]